jgi:hypothetical protein
VKLTQCNKQLKTAFKLPTYCTVKTNVYDKSLTIYKKLKNIISEPPLPNRQTETIEGSGMKLIHISENLERKNMRVSATLRAAILFKIIF